MFPFLNSEIEVNCSVQCDGAIGFNFRNVFRRMSCFNLFWPVYGYINFRKILIFKILLNADIENA